MKSKDKSSDEIKSVLIQPCEAGFHRKRDFIHQRWISPVEDGFDCVFSVKDNTQSRALPKIRLLYKFIDYGEQSLLHLAAEELKKRGKCNAYSEHTEEEERIFKREHNAVGVLTETEQLAGKYRCRHCVIRWRSCFYRQSS